jgi:hypothetical protein
MAMLEEHEGGRLGPQGVVVIGTICSCGYFGFVFLVTRYTYRVHVFFGLFWSLSFALAGLAAVFVGYQLIRNGLPDPNSRLRRRFIPMFLPVLEKYLRQGIDPESGKVREIEFAFFTPVVILFLSSWASLAYGVAKVFPWAYPHPERMSFWLMFKHYLWQLVDMVPLVDAWKHIHIEDPILETNLWPGVMVLIFRLIILFVVVVAASKLLGLDKGRKKSE